MTADEQYVLEIQFSSLIASASVSRSVFLDTTNRGLETTMLGSNTGTDGSYIVDPDIDGLFSVTEAITVTAQGPGATLSADDSVTVVPEPSPIAVLGLGLIGLGAIRYRRRG